MIKLMMVLWPPLLPPLLLLPLPALLSPWPVTTPSPSVTLGLGLSFVIRTFYGDLVVAVFCNE